MERSVLRRGDEMVSKDDEELTREERTRKTGDPPAPTMAGRDGRTIGPIELAECASEGQDVGPGGEPNPSLRAVGGRDDGICSEPSRAAAIRQQIAIVRALVDEIERCLPGGSDPIPERLVEELARLGCRCVELGAVVAEQVGS